MKSSKAVCWQQCKRQVRAVQCKEKTLPWMRTCAALCLGQPVMLSITAVAPEDWSSSRRDPIVASFQQGKYTDHELSRLLPYSQCAWETSQQPLQRIKSKSESPQAAELSVASRGRCYIKKGSYSSGSQVLWESQQGLTIEKALGYNSHDPQHVRPWSSPGSSFSDLAFPCISFLFNSAILLS